MASIDRALQLETVAPQWRPDVGAEGDASGPSAAPTELPQRIKPLYDEELAALEQLPEEEETAHLSDAEQEFLRRSIESLDYLGDWADPRIARDSIVLCCETPDVLECETGKEFVRAHAAEPPRSRSPRARARWAARGGAHLSATHADRP